MIEIVISKATFHQVTQKAESTEILQFTKNARLIEGGQGHILFMTHIEVAHLFVRRDSLMPLALHWKTIEHLFYEFSSMFCRSVSGTLLGARDDFYCLLLLIESAVTSQPHLYAITVA